MQDLKILYEDKFITVNEIALNIKKYYFPLGTSRVILFSEMEKISLETALNVNHLWGTSSHFLNNWFNYDSERSNKDKFLDITIKNCRIKPSVTCDDVTKVFNVLRAHFLHLERKSVMFHSNKNKQTQLDQRQAHQMKKQELQLEELSKQKKLKAEELPAVAEEQIQKIAQDKVNKDESVNQQRKKQQPKVQKIKVQQNKKDNDKSDEEDNSMNNTENELNIKKQQQDQQVVQIPKEGKE